MAVSAYAKVRSPQCLGNHNGDPRELGGDPGAYGYRGERLSAEARAERIQRAIELRATGMSYDRIGAMVGNAGSTIRTWLTGAVGRTDKAESSERLRSVREEDVHRGGRMPICRECHARETRAVRSRMARMWNEGAELSTIAEAVGRTPRTVATNLAMMRNRGVDIDTGLRRGKRRSARYATEVSERERQIAALHRQGLTAGAIARKLGMSEGGVCQAIRRMRTRGMRLPNQAAALSRAREGEVAQRLRQGKTQARVARDLALKPGTVHVIAKRLRRKGVPMPPSEAERLRRRDRAVAHGLSEGNSGAEVARSLGITYACMRAALRRLERRGEFPTAAPRGAVGTS